MARQGDEVVTTGASVDEVLENVRGKGLHGTVTSLERVDVDEVRSVTPDGHVRSDLELAAARHRAMQGRGEEPSVAVRNMGQPDDRYIHDALVSALVFLEHRDRMNAALHCAKVRWSPLTVRVREAVRLLEGDG